MRTEFGPARDICRSDLKLIRCPALIIHGDRDPLIELEQAEVAAREISDSRLERFPMGSHHLHQQFPQKFASMVEDFLNE